VSMRSWLLSMVLMSSCLLRPVCAADALESGFKDPPKTAQPLVWWDWMNGNITKEGIALDLQWMRRIGIGGFQLFDVGMGTPQIVGTRLGYLSPGWSDAFRYATTLADELGMEVGIASSPGFSETGGPWVLPSHGMKKLVWSETQVAGGTPFRGVLAHPPTTSGPFQGIPAFNLLAGINDQAPGRLPKYYADIAVLGYRARTVDVPVAKLLPKLTSSSPVDINRLSNPNFDEVTEMPKSVAGHPAWIQYEFPQPQAMDAVTLALNDPLGAIFGSPIPIADLEVSDDGRRFRKLAAIPSDGAMVHTTVFPKAVARFFRIQFVSQAPIPRNFGLKFDAPYELTGPTLSDTYQILQLYLHRDPRIDRAAEKAGFAIWDDVDASGTPAGADDDAIVGEDIVDLTDKTRADGTLNWTPPPGRWVILRFGESLTGSVNHPAEAEATGLEVDKLSAEDVRDYLNAYLQQYERAAGPLMKAQVHDLVNDSWEAGPANWTDNMVGEFNRRRGYDIRKWLPVLTGRVVESSRASERFLWDFREVLGELVADNHYRLIADMLHRRGMSHYSESHEQGRAFIGDGMDAKRDADVPMGAMWTDKPGVVREQYGFNADLRESASVAHIYGQNLVAAESLTSNSGAYSWSPATLKPTIDQELARGVNRIVIHTSPHQPLVNGQPGLSMGPFGQWFTRNDTWAELAAPWISYLTRSSYLLQQGRFVADIAYFYGEDANLTEIFEDRAPDIPDGYSFDYVSASALKDELVAKAGRLVTPHGMSYRVLMLDPRSRMMSLPVLRKIHQLVEAGAVVIGAGPIDTPSLSDDEAEFQRLANELWRAPSGMMEFGKGMIIAGQSLKEALQGIQVSPDFQHSDSVGLAPLFVHRQVGDVDVYYIDNPNDHAVSVDGSFRVSGREAELWHADTGEIEPASYDIAAGRTTVPLHLDAWGALFVVFRKESKVSSRHVPAPTEHPLQILTGTWEVSFEPGRGAPESAIFAHLSPWNESPIDGIKYFSGTATYTKAIVVPPGWLHGHSHVWIDLGDVKSLAQVDINGKSLGILWKSPYRTDATRALRPGTNIFKVRITNDWRNRIIGDRQPQCTKTYTLTSPMFFTAASPLEPSGLMGPVKFIQQALH
jgi:hypothetical protein